MFADIAAARDALTEFFYEESVEMLLDRLRPAVALEAADAASEPVLGATRLGGMPDLPATVPWPLRAASSQASAIAARGGSRHGDHIRKHLAEAMPFQFLAQVDLAEACRLGDVAHDLPDTGRLLFFYDASVGPWHDGRESCRVIWDRTPATLLARQSLPVPLQDDPRYNAVALSDFGEQYLSREIWDGNRPRIYQAASEWRLLLQVDLADYLQERLAEGTVYFLITQDALAARAFEQVVTVYQQT
jgi:hypothetical protein